MKSYISALSSDGIETEIHETLHTPLSAALIIHLIHALPDTLYNERQALHIGIQAQLMHTPITEITYIINLLK